MSFTKYSLVPKEELDRLKQKQLQQYDPNWNALVRFQEAAKQFLDDNTLSPDQRMQRYGHAHALFLQMYKPLKPTTKTQITSQDESTSTTPDVAPADPTPAVPVPAAMVTPVSTTTTSSFKAEEKGEQMKPVTMNEMITRGIPAKQVGNSQEILQILAKNPDVVNVDSVGQVVIDGKVIPHSNFVDLMHSLYTQRSSINTAGQSIFLRALAKLNVSKNLVSNRKYLPSSFATPTTRAKTRKSKLRSNFPTAATSVVQEGHGRKHHRHPPGKRIRLIRVYNV